MIARAPTAVEEALIREGLLAARELRPYYGVAIAALTPRCVDGLATIAVGADWSLYVDPSWYADLPLRHRGGVIASHEVEHLLRAHGGRRGPRDEVPWNIAGDMEINDDADLADLPPGVILPEYPGLTAERYYNDADRHEGGAACGGGSGAGRPRLFEPAAGVQPAGVTADQADAIRDQVAADVREYVRAHGRDSVPAGVVIWADARAPRSSIDWRSRLAAEVRRAATSARGRQDYSWSRLSRRTSPLPRPGATRPIPRVALIVDTSGSMVADGAAVIAQAEAIASAAGTLSVIACDAAVTSRGSRLPRSWRGGGGTDLRVALADRACARADVIVVLTDGDTPWPTGRPGARVIVCCRPDAALTPEWATRIAWSAP